MTKAEKIMHQLQENEFRTVGTEDIVRAVNIANDLRAEFGAPPIDDLPLGKRNDSNHCILARAFNFSCQITPSSISKNGEWVARFYDHEEEVKKFAELLGTSDTIKSFDTSSSSHSSYNTIYLVDIPEEIANIARQFDYGNLPQYDADAFTEGDL